MRFVPHSILHNMTATLSADHHVQSGLGLLHAVTGKRLLPGHKHQPQLPFGAPYARRDDTEPIRRHAYGVKRTLGSRKVDHEPPGIAQGEGLEVAHRPGGLNLYGLGAKTYRAHSDRLHGSRHDRLDHGSGERRHRRHRTPERRLLLTFLSRGR